MKIEKSFVVAAPRHEVWAFLTDPVKVASCLPGAAITERVDDRTYKGTMTVKVGPVVASYRGTLKFERLDEAAGEAELAASATETRGKGAADMRMVSRVVEGEGGTEVVVTSDVNVVGVLAQFGRGMIDDVSDQLFGRFSAEMRRQLESGGEAAGTAAEGVAAAPAPAPAGGASSPAAPAAGLPAASAAPSVPPATPPAPAAAAPPLASPPAAAAPPGTAAAGAAAPARADVLDLGSLGGVAAGRAALRTLRRPAFWIVVAVLVVAVWFLL